MKKPRFGPGDRVFFEYHCLQSDESCDAELWHHTRQWAVVVAVVTHPEVDLELSPMYIIRFEDDYQHDVFNDEVTERPRPKPEERGVIVPNPQPRTITLNPNNPEEYEWASWMITGMHECMDPEDYEDFGYTPADIPLLKRVGNQAWIEIENLNALEDLLYRIEEQAGDMVDYEIKQFRNRGLRPPALLRAQKEAQVSLAEKLRTAFDEMSVS